MQLCHAEVRTGRNNSRFYVGQWTEKNLLHLLVSTGRAQIWKVQLCYDEMRTGNDKSRFVLGTVDREESSPYTC